MNVASAAGGRHQRAVSSPGLLVELGDHDPGALRREHLRGDTPHAATRTGDDRDLVLQSHGTPSHIAYAKGTARAGRRGTRSSFVGRAQDLGVGEHLFDDLGRGRQPAPFLGRPRPDHRRERGDATVPSRATAAIGPPRWRYADDPSVRLVRQAVDEAVRCHAGHESGHGRWRDALRGGQRADGSRTTEHQDGKRRQSRRRRSPATRSSWARRRSKWRDGSVEPCREGLVGGCARGSWDVY